MGIFFNIVRDYPFISIFGENTGQLESWMIKPLNRSANSNRLFITDDTQQSKLLKHLHFKL